MNIRQVFQPSERTRGEDAAKAIAAAAERAKTAKKSATMSEAEPSEEELAMWKAVAVDETSELARIWLNGELVRVGLTWMPGMKERWIAAGNADLDLD